MNSKERPASQYEDRTSIEVQALHPTNYKEYTQQMPSHASKKHDTLGTFARHFGDVLASRTTIVSFSRIPPLAQASPSFQLTLDELDSG